MTVKASDELILRVPPLIKEQPIIQAIYRIGDDIVVKTEKYNSTARETVYSFWKLDKKNDRFKPFSINEANKVVAVSENGLSELIATSNGANLHLKFINQPKRNRSVSASVESPFLLCANMNFVYMVYADKIIELSNKGSIRAIRIKGSFAEKWRAPPRAVAITENELILGYDMGEWGGCVYSVKIDKSGLIPNFNLLLSENVCAIAKDSTGKIWIASGLSHLGLTEAGLHFYDGKTITTLISQESIRNEDMGKESQAPLSLSDATKISGMTINAKDEVVFVAAELGIFSCTVNKPLRILWEGNLYIEYLMPEYGVGSFPQGIIEMGNKLYVASRSLGVFRFEMLENGNYIPTKQIVFKARSSNKTNSADVKAAPEPSHLVKKSRINQVKTPQEFFDLYVKLEYAFDSSVADLYSNDAVIRNTRIYPTGQRRTISIPTSMYKNLIRKCMPLTKARGDNCTYRDVTYTQEGDGTRIKATRYSNLKNYDSPISILVKKNDKGQWLIYEEIAQSQP